MNGLYMAGCFFSGMLFVMAVMVLVPESKLNQYNNAITACEKNLPRSAKCVITAVPETKDE